MKGKFSLSSLDLKRYKISGAGQMQQASFDLHGVISREAGPWTYDLEAKVAGLRAELLEPFNPQWAQKLKDLSPVAAGWRLKGPAWRGPRRIWTGPWTPRPSGLAGSAWSNLKSAWPATPGSRTCAAWPEAISASFP